MLPPYLRELRRLLEAVANPTAQALVQELDEVSRRTRVSEESVSTMDAKDLDLGKLLQEAMHMGGFSPNPPVPAKQKCPKCGFEF